MSRGIADTEPPAGSGSPSSPDRPPRDLPDQLTSFIGREQELEEVHGLLEATRLLTLTGAGGCGKTRLALEAAAGLLEGFPDGACWVELAAVSDRALVGHAVAEALGVRALPGHSALDAAIMHLSSRRALVVLDNCEHLLEEAARCAEALLRGCPQLDVLATSRAPLGIGVETTWRVPPLSLPAEEAPDDVDELTQSDAVRLFVDRALKVQPHFNVTSDTAPALAAICTDLDGIPLAIELAAARARMLSIEQIARGLSDRFHLLTGGVRSALPRHRTLRASVDWSHDLLEADERTLFRRLAVFAGGFTLDAAEDVCEGDGLERDTILDLLTSLVDKSLALAEERGAAVRYRLLETMRQYGADRLTESGETERVRDRHRDCFLALAERAEPELNTPRQEEWLDLLDPEAANFAAAIDWALESDAHRALRLSVALTFWWRLRGRFAEAESAYARALEAAGADQPSSLRARALRGRAWHRAMAGDFIGSFTTASEALAMAEEVGDDGTAARALDVLGLVQLWGDPIRSRPLFERSRELARAAGDDWCWIDATMSLGASFTFQGEGEPALELFDEALPLIERLGHREFLSLQGLNRAAIRWQRGDLTEARELLERSLAVSREVGEPVYESWAITFGALIEADQGNAEHALELLAAARERAVAAGIGWALNWIHISSGYAHAALGQLEPARNELETAVALGAAQGGADWWSCQALRMLAAVLRLSGDADGGRARAMEAVGSAARMENEWLGAQARLVLAALALDAGGWTEAETLAHEALAVIAEHDFRPDLPEALDLLAEVAAGLESHAEAARLVGVAARCRDELGVVRWVDHERRSAALAGRLSAAMGEAQLQAALAEGGGLEADEAVAWIRRGRGSRKRPPGGWESLTPTELEVVKLASQGLTNPEIGERMFISRHTVKVHLSHIYGKLGVKNRSELAAETARRPSPQGLGAA